MIEIDKFPTKQLVDGKYVSPPPELCLVCAERVFQERIQQGDTNPRIVQMVLFGQPIPHWYCRTDQWVEQPYLKASEGLQPYVGPIDSAYPWLYSEGTYIDEEEMTGLLLKKYLA